jgi:Protein of unknown function (DUF2971)
MNEQEIWGQFSVPLFADIKEEEEYYNRKPFLAHYTSIDVLEKILRSDEIWFSNPLFMNDLEEVRFGVINGAKEFKGSKLIGDALQTEARRSRFAESLDHYIAYFEREHLLDTYVFCLTEQDKENQDGLLSMWRGYGGSGKGVAIVFDTSKLGVPQSGPLILARVNYGSDSERFLWFEEKAKIFARTLTDIQIPDEKIHLAAHALLERLKLFALFTKHHGFKEEREWRVVYMSERDTDKKPRFMRHYVIGPRGVEPKLRVKIGQVEGATGPSISFEEIIHAILLGPSISSVLAVRSMRRMLEVIERPKLNDRLFASSIPLRAI